MKRSLLLNIEEHRDGSSWNSSLLRILKAVSWLVPLAFINSLQAQTSCDSLDINYTVTSPTCNGSVNGTISVTMNGGLAPYVYLWSNGAVSEDLTGLSAGAYTLIASDQNGCADTVTVTLYQPSPINNVVQEYNVLCNGGATGYIMTSVSGGTSPYNYFWSNGSQSAHAINLTAGTYIVTVVDYRGCSRKDTAVIIQPDPLNISISSPEHNNGYNVSTYLGNDGSIDLGVSGGVSPYTYVWSNAAVTEDLSSLSAGVYSVVATDANNCTISASITLDQPVKLEIPSGFTPNSDGSNDNFVVHGVEENPDNVLTVFNRWGNIVYQKKNYSNQWSGTNNRGEELPDGTYFVILEVSSKELILKGYVEMKRH
jgi:gliding motility-associated-like protein